MKDKKVLTPEEEIELLKAQAKSNKWAIGFLVFIAVLFLMNM